MKCSIIALFLTFFMTLSTARNIQWYQQNSDEVDCHLAENQAILHPHPSSCSLYLQCDNGEAVERPCPAGTEFSPSQRVCVHADQSDCTAEDDNDDSDENVVSSTQATSEVPLETTTSEEPTTGQSESESPTEVTDDASTATTEESTTGESTTGESESESPTEVTDDASTTTTEESTTGESESESPTEVTEDASTATTGESESESPTEVTEDASTTTPEETTSVTDADVSTIEGSYFSQMICDDESSRASSNAMPDPSDCTQYYACVSGVATLRKCASGQRFDTASSICAEGACA